MVREHILDAISVRVDEMVLRGLSEYFHCVHICLFINSYDSGISYLLHKCECRSNIIPGPGMHGLIDLRMIYIYIYIW